MLAPSPESIKYRYTLAYSQNKCKVFSYFLASNYSKNETSTLFKQCTLKMQKTLLSKSLFSMRATGFEPTTFWSVARRSIQLSYARSRNARIILSNREIHVKH